METSDVEQKPSQRATTTQAEGTLAGTVAPFDVEEPPVHRPNTCKLLLDVFLPFLLLSESGHRRRNVDRPAFFKRFAERWRALRPVLPRAPRVSKFFLMLLLLFLLIHAGVVYLFLSISSMTPFLHMEDHKMRNVTLKPRVGNHWTNAIMGKYLLQVAIIYYLCWQVLELDPFVAKARLEDPDRLNKPGLVHFFRKVAARLFCYPYQEMWLSTQFIDHMLLILVGLPYSILQPMLACIHIELREKGIELQGALQGDGFMLISGALGLYSGLLMVGFLCTTLGNGVRPRSGYAYVFQLCTLALAILMALEFLVQQYARQRYSQFHLKEKLEEIWYYNAARVSMSASQLFATHSLCMLCAMHLGHAQHFEKCPDLPWRVACKEALAIVVFMLAVSWLGYFERIGHLWPLCRPRKFMIGALWDCGMFGLRIIVGLALLLAGLKQSTEVIKLGTDADWKLVTAMMKLFDLDSFLIFVTFLAASGHLLVEIYDLYAEKLYILWDLQILESMYPLGIAVFTFASWKQPPLHGFSRRCLWLALAIVFEDFIHSQLLEDCEFASSMPGCCAFPSMHDVNADGGHRLWEMCALDHRCAHKHPASHSDNTAYFCKLPLDFHAHGHGQPAHAAHPETDAHAEFLRWATLAKHPAGPSCDEMKNHWSEFPDALKIEESSEHEESFSTAFKQFKTMGAAGNIEFSFAVLGILMKVILFVAHPHSKRILQLRSESHGVH